MLGARKVREEARFPGTDNASNTSTMNGFKADLRIALSADR